MSPFCPKTGQPTTKEAYDEFHRQMKNRKPKETQAKLWREVMDMIANLQTDELPEKFKIIRKDKR
jgi:protoheme ferro-lyase